MDLPRVLARGRRDPRFFFQGAGQIAGARCVDSPVTRYQPARASVRFQIGGASCVDSPVLSYRPARASVRFRIGVTGCVDSPVLSYQPARASVRFRIGVTGCVDSRVFFQSFSHSQYPTAEPPLGACQSVGGRTDGPTRATAAASLRSGGIGRAAPRRGRTLVHPGFAPDFSAPFIHFPTDLGGRKAGIDHIWKRGQRFRPFPSSSGFDRVPGDRCYS